ncbi:Chemotaxis response regulator protein-glutamate methylesterase of group 2 operon [Clostridioides difficile]|nr:chemotaxis protein CheB [Clostridioides difficile]CZR95772.1 Chemotaxis response regulator protein-glutamate methylesterase of group 2 operon [Clostridioides difficile]CZS06297.1 Chemotaxis response regulator protein-glutamate methylesterase of group 2 operon [Clostridioides difficile]
MEHFNNMVIAIGASVGGTEAILEIIKDLPKSTPGVVVVQHMPAIFTDMYAQRLDKQCVMNVREAKNNDRVERGNVLIAPGGYQMKLHVNKDGYYVTCKKGEKVSGHCPSVDVLFDSVAEVAGKNSIGIILTGMGSDGANGLLKMREKGSFTIGQDEKSCIVYGMPMVAFDRGSVVLQLPLDEISNCLIRHLNI